MKKRLPSFLAGMTAMALALTLGASALAASGQVSFNFAGVSLNGETKIAAGENITAVNGQQIPGTILYTDAAGGKTSYLPIRAIGEMLGVEVDYDSAARTILLKTQTGQANPRWTMTLEDGSLRFRSEDDGTKYDTPPAYRPAWQAEGWGLAQLRGFRSSASWEYRCGDGRMTFQCCYPGSEIGYGMFTDPEKAMEQRQQLVIQGSEADLYAEGEESLLVWENREGLLFYMTGRNAKTEDLIKMAQSVQPCGEKAAYEPQWLPEGCHEFESVSAGDAMQTLWMTKEGYSMTLLAASTPMAGQAGKAETVRVNGRAAKFWAAADPPASPGKGFETQTVGNVVITSGVTSGFGSADMNTLTWSDPDAGTHFMLLSALDRDTMVRIAKNVAVK